MCCRAQGKTMLARSIVAEASRHGVPRMEFIALPPSSLLSKYVGESEKQMAEVFACAKRGDGSALLFFDEVDSFALQRGDDTDSGTRRLLLESLLQLSDLQRTSSAGEHRPVIVVAATNAKIEELDASFVRRFERQIEVPLPDAAARELMLRCAHTLTCCAVRACCTAGSNPCELGWSGTT
jgi:SpoVK/Ycf46/Vps4 family AAA+-type ATPase